LEPFPLEWAHAQIGLGDALAALSKWEDREERLKEAIAAYELDLNTELTLGRDTRWGRTRNTGYGLALSRLGELQTDRMAFGRAEVALRQALSVWTSGHDNDLAIEALAYVHRRLKERS
jgi:tetratricopeptide (TPR) repeat protein